MRELVYGVGNILIYFCTALAILLPARKLIHIYDELFRKILHFVLLGALIIWTISFQVWWIKIITVIGFVIIVYPILKFFERFKTYSQVITERKKGELKSSLVVVFLMFSLVIAVAEGIFEDSYLTVAGICAWGLGDAFAALVGKKFGKHKLEGKYLTGKKSLEGTFTMFLISCLSVFAILAVRGGVSVGGLIIISVMTGAVSALCELYTKDGMDTIACPLASMVIMIVLLFVFGGL